MTLLLDVGNSRIKWQESHQFTDTPMALSYDSQNLTAQLSNIPERGGKSDSVVYIASVAGPAVNRVIKSWIGERWGTEVRFLSSSAEWRGLRNGYDAPELLGVDRWCALIGAAVRYPYPLMVCDIGTAMTIDVVDQKGVHLGGFIVPGYELMVNSLTHKTEIRLLDEERSSSRAIPTNTSMAVHKGCMQSLASLIDSVKGRYAHEANCILTGGHAEGVALLLESKFTVDRNLVFHGILNQIEKG